MITLFYLFRAAVAMFPYIFFICFPFLCHINGNPVEWAEAAILVLFHELQIHFQATLKKFFKKIAGQLCYVNFNKTFSTQVTF